MAGDWIKMRTDLGDDPAVIGMASSLETSEDDIVGKLHRLWAWADRHTSDGVAVGITSRWVDRYIAKPGFSEAMVKVGWLVVNESSVVFPNFDRHNGASAKSRAEASIRQRLSRKNRDEGVTGVTRDLIPKPFRRHVLTRDGYRCVYCGSQSSAENESDSRFSRLSIDHIVPATRGGKTAIENLVSCCKACNQEKGDRTPEEWGMTLGFLANGVTYSAGSVTEMSQGSCDASVTREEKRREEKRSASLMVSEHVDAVYSAYPRKVARKDAEKAIRKALMEVGFDDLLAKVTAYAAAVRGSDPQFIPYPASWFNAGRYEDDPATWKPSAPSNAHRPTVADERNRFIGGQEIWEATSGKQLREEGKGFGIE